MSGIDFTELTASGPLASSNSVNIAGRQDSQGKREYLGYSVESDTVGEAVLGIYHGTDALGPKLDTVRITAPASDKNVLPRGLKCQNGIHIVCEQGSFKNVTIYHL